MPYKDGKTWRGVIKTDGIRKQKRFDTKKEAKEWEAEQKKLLLMKTSVQSSSGLGLANFCQKYLEFASRYTLNVFKEKQSLARRVITEWGINTPVSEIDEAKVIDYLDKQARERSNNASNRDRKNLLAMWNYGITYLKLTHNPVAVIKKRSHTVARQYTPPPEDIEKLLSVATQEELVFLDCYLQTAARRSEIFRLKWDDVDFGKRKIRVGSRKSKDGSMTYRTLDMSNDLYESLLWQRKNTKFPDHEYVFVSDSPQRYGQPFKVRRKFMAGICRRAGIRPFGFHALRRYVASILAENCVSLKAIQQVLGHHNIAVTDRYVQNLRSDLQDTMNLLNIRKKK